MRGQIPGMSARLLHNPCRSHVSIKLESSCRAPEASTRHWKASRGTLTPLTPATARRPSNSRSRRLSDFSGYPVQVRRCWHAGRIIPSLTSSFNWHSNYMQKKFGVVLISLLGVNICRLPERHVGRAAELSPAPARDNCRIHRQPQSMAKNQRIHDGACLPDSA